MRLKFNESERKKSECPKGYEEIYKTVTDVEVVSDTENKSWSIENLKNQLLESFKATGEKALVANDGKIYTTLSGGLDSTLALALLRSNFPNAKIITFTMGGDENHPDIQYARLAAEKFNTQGVEIIPTTDEIQKTLEEYKETFPTNDLKEAVEKGDFDVYLLYKYIACTNAQSLIVHDSADELMGGYWDHRKKCSSDERKRFFAAYWKRLIPEHLDPLIQTSQNFNIKLLFPYLDEKLVRLISKIPVEDRASDKIGKKPLRKVAVQFGVPEEIINRTKRGQLGMTEIEGLRE